MAHTVRTTIAHGPALPRVILKNLQIRLAVWRSRRALAELDADALKDIGVTARDARREADMGVWDVPASWREA